MKFIGTTTPGSMKITSWNVMFDIALDVINTVIEPGGSEESVVDDLNVTTYTEATILTEGQLSAYNFNPAEASRLVEFESLDESMGTVDQYGRVTRVSDGDVPVLLKSFWAIRRYDVPVVLTPGAVTTISNSFVDGCMGKEISDNIDNLIGDVTSENANTYKPIFSIQDHTNGIYIRNTSCWAYSLDLTCISPWNSYGGAYRAGTLISPRHIALANHYGIPSGSTIRFITTDNQIITRTVGSSLQPAGYNDIKIAVLDSDVPSSISFAKVLPANWASYLPGLAFGVPTIFTDQEEKALINVWKNMPNEDTHKVYFVSPTDAYEHRLALYEPVVGGDSGNPCFIIVNGELVLLTTWWSVNTGSFYTDFIDAINTVMTTLGGGYQLTQVDLSSFPTYS